MPCKRTSLSIGALLGNLEGVRLPGTFERKEKYVWVPFLDPEVIQILSLSETLASFGNTYLGSFFLDREDIRKLSIGAIQNFGRNRASLI
jgi:hypothetical protein